MEAVLLLFLIACGTKDAWQEQYDLGMHYLNGGNYQEAVIAFEAAIEIDAKRPKAYLGAAEAYKGMGDVDSARKILEQGYAVTNDSSLASSYEAPQIGELYSEDFDYTDSVGNSGHYTYHVPQITADTQGAAAINRAIEDVYGPIVSPCPAAPACSTCPSRGRPINTTISCRWWCTAMWIWTRISITFICTTLPAAGSSPRPIC